MEAICLKLLQHFFSLLASASLLPIRLTLFGRKATSLVRLQPQLYNPAPVHSSPKALLPLITPVQFGRTYPADRCSVSLSRARQPAPVPVNRPVRLLFRCMSRCARSTCRCDYRPRTSSPFKTMVGTPNTPSASASSMMRSPFWERNQWPRTFAIVVVCC
jgi:hypothetical protein